MTKLAVFVVAIFLSACRSPCGHDDWVYPKDIEIFEGFSVVGFKEVNPMAYQVSFENRTEYVVVNAGVEMEVWSGETLVFEELFVMDSDVLPGNVETELFSLQRDASPEVANEFARVRETNAPLKVSFKVQGAVGQKL